MTETEVLSKLKFRISNLESTLNEKQKVIDQYKFIETEADSKIKAMQKIHAEKIKSLLYSIQVLKKQKASLQGLSKQHKRSKLIEQLNKQINDQDLVIQILRKSIYEEKGKQTGRKFCDDIIIKALNKGPERIRPMTREELRMEIQRLKQINMGLEKKLKMGDKMNRTRAQLQGDDSLSIASSEEMLESTVSQSRTEQMLNRIRSLQLQLQSFKLQSSSKTKIIEKLKASLTESEKYRTEVELLRNEIQIANRKVYSLDKILRENKETTNKKIIDLYERELKVEELQIIGQQKSDKLKSIAENTNILIQQIKAEKLQLQARYEQLKQQNEKILLENITNKKQQQNQKVKIQEIKQLNEKQKTNLSNKLMQYENQVQRILAENGSLKEQLAALNGKVFAERAQWIEEKQALIEEIQQLRANKAQSEQIASLMRQLEQLKQQNQRLQAIFATDDGATSGNSKLLLERLQAYRRKVEYYQNMVNKGQKNNQISIYNQLFEKYNKLIQQFQAYKQANPEGKGKKHAKQRKQHIALTREQKMHYDNLSSGIDDMDLAEVDSQILQNFNTSYEYEIDVQDGVRDKRMPKITQADKELLKLINSDLWCFIKDDQVDQKLDQVSQLVQNPKQLNLQRDVKKLQKIRNLKNLSHPQGQKITLYEEEVSKLDQMSDNVSATSAMMKQIDNYDSDVNVQFEKLNQNDLPQNINLSKLQNLSYQVSSENDISSFESGDSAIKKRKKTVLQKATKINFKTSRRQIDIGSSVMSSESRLSEDMLNSDVSSVNISDRQLNRIDSDVETDFRKKKARK